MTAAGRPFSVPGFGNLFRDYVREAGLEGVSLHGLRKTGAVRMLEAGATVAQVQAVGGWQPLASFKSISGRETLTSWLCRAWRRLRRPSGM
jgi:site-specific recombinase XerD